MTEVHGTRALPCNTSWCHPHSAPWRALLPSVAGREPHPSPGPLRRCLSPPPCRGYSQRGVGLRLSRPGLSSRRICQGKHTAFSIWQKFLRSRPVAWRLPTHTLSVRRCGWYSSGVFAVVSCGQTFSGVVGLISSRQPKSPRARPWISISAVAALVAKGTLCWSHRLVI